MQWILAKTRRMLLVENNVKSTVGPSEVLYAAVLSEGRLDPDLSKCNGMSWAVAWLIVVVALYECHQCWA
jgi:hypothetical protein